MQFHLLDNAVDSLKFGIRHYKKFLDNSDKLTMDINEYFSDLKFATIAIHNAIELFTKQILYDVNELLIFNFSNKGEFDIKNELITKLLYKKYKEGRKDANIDFWLAGDIDVSSKTIDYKDCIAILYKIFKEELSQKNYQTLDTLGKMRNCMTHLGYWDDFGWYKIMITLNDTLTLVKQYYYDNIHNSEKYIEAKLIGEIISLKEYADFQLNLQWIASNEVFLSPLYDYLDDFFDKNTTDCKFDIDRSSLELKKIKFIRKEITIELIGKFLPREESLLFLNSNKIRGIFNLSEFKWKKATDGIPTDIIYDSIYMYYPKEDTYFDIDMVLDWKNFRRCETAEHMINQLSKE